MIVAPIRRCSVSFRHRTRVPVLRTSTATNRPYLHSSQLTWNEHFSSLTPTFSVAVGHVNTRTLSTSSDSLTAQRHSRSNLNANMTNKIVERNGGRHANNIKTLYDPSRETENCGVGLIASLKSIPSRHIVSSADEMLVRMAHRGGCGCDPASGDGSGKRRRYIIYFYHAVIFLKQWM